MVNSAKTPTGKAKKGQVTVRPDSGSVKACFPRSYFEDGKQLKLATGINPDNWEAASAKLQRRLQIELEDGKLTKNGVFDQDRYREILEDYGLRAKLRVIKGGKETSDQLPPKPQLSLLKVWDMYCEYKKSGLRESVYVSMYQGQYKKNLESAIEATKSEDALKIRNWLVENRNLATVKQVLSILYKGYQLAIKNGFLTHNPYDGLKDDITVKGAKGKTQDEVNNDRDVLDKSKAYTWDEAQIILEFIRENYSWWYDFFKFKFLTGCRTGEAIALMWGDIEWTKERILIRRTYDKITKKFYPLKNDKTYKGEECRRFPMTKDGELWMLLKSIPEGDDNEIIFKSKQGKMVSQINAGHIWRGCPSNKIKGIIPQLIEQQIIAKYLPPYNTRHTFITHAVFDLGIDEKIVSKWCGHSINVSNKHYQDVAVFAERVNPEQSQRTELDILKEQLRQQQELINQLLANQQKITNND